MLTDLGDLQTYGALFTAGETFWIDLTLFGFNGNVFARLADLLFVVDLELM